MIPAKPYRYLRRTARAPDLAVPVVKAKPALRIEHASEDSLLADKLKAAEETVEARTGRILRPTDFELLVEHPADERLELQVWPVRDVAEVAFRNSAGVWEPMIAEEFELLRQSDESAWLDLRPGAARQAAGPSPGLPNVRVRFSAGYGDAGEDADLDPELELPARVSELVLLLAGHLFEHREAVTNADMMEVPLAATWTIQELRIFS